MSMEVWVKATSVQAEDEEPIQSVARRGWGTHFLAEPSRNWFHISVTTPILPGNGRFNKLTRVAVLYRTVNSEIASLHIYDGANLIKEFNNLSLKEDHSKTMDEVNCWIINEPIEVRYGLGISIEVSFLPQWGEVLFTAVGAEFI
jgi:hypothetical protein